MTSEQKVLDASIGGNTRRGIMIITKLTPEQVDKAITRLYIQERIGYSSGRWYARSKRK